MSRRMFESAVMETNTFQSLPKSSQLLYFYLNLYADDDGFVDNSKFLVRAYGFNEDDLNVLILKEFLIYFEDEAQIIVIRHWHEHNSIRSDRYKETKYIELKQRLVLVNNEYKVIGIEVNETNCLPGGNQMSTNCQPSDNQMTPQVNISQDNKSKAKLSEVNTSSSSPAFSNSKSTNSTAPTLKDVENFCWYERYNNVDPKRFYEYYSGKNWMINGKPIVNWKGVVISWESNSFAKQDRLNREEKQKQIDIRSREMKAATEGMTWAERMEYEKTVEGCVHV